MKKKLVIITSLLIAISTLQVFAKKDKKKQEKIAESTEKVDVAIVSPNDTLSYAFGVNMAKQGLGQYLEQMGISSNAEKLDLFIKGFNESMLEMGENSSYISGLGVGDQIYNLSKDFSKEISEDENSYVLNAKLIAKAVNDVLSKNAIAIDSTEAIVNKKYMELSKKKEELEKQKNAAIIEESKQFMEENKTKKDVVSLPSGLQYKIVLQGKGPIPTAEDRVKVHYKGTLVDGTEFDNSFSRGEPLVFGVEQVIKGWTEALELMPVGSKWILYIPYELAYGERGNAQIPPYANLIFEVDLMDIEKE